MHVYTGKPDQCSVYYYCEDAANPCIKNLYFNTYFLARASLESFLIGELPPALYVRGLCNVVKRLDYPVAKVESSYICHHLLGRFHCWFTCILFIFMCAVMRIHLLLAGYKRLF